jgi:hypothetical protein
VLGYTPFLFKALQRKVIVKAITAVCLATFLALIVIGSIVFGAFCFNSRQEILADYNLKMDEANSRIREMTNQINSDESELLIWKPKIDEIKTLESENLDLKQQLRDALSKNDSQTSAIISYQKILNQRQAMLVPSPHHGLP